MKRQVPIEKKVKVFPKDDLQLDAHTWKKGLDYEAVFRFMNDKKTRLTIASDQGQVNFTDSALENLHDVFEFGEGESKC